MNQTITKAVFPVAGIGSRFLPVTKASPKEMLPIVDKPLIQYAVEEAIACGITELIFVTSGNKRAIEDHFDTNFELEQSLETKEKLQLLSAVKNIIPKGVTCSYIRQGTPRGLGHAILCAQSLIKDSTFAVILPDDLIDSPQKSCLAQMMEAYSKTGKTMVAVEKVAGPETHRYGIIEAQDPYKELTPLKDIVEKPIENPPSNLAVVGRYILKSEIFAHLARTKLGSGKEIQLTDALRSLLKKEPVYSYQFKGTRYDCGTKIGFLQANVAFAVKHEEIGADFNHYLRTFATYLQTA